MREVPAVSHQTLNMTPAAVPRVVTRVSTQLLNEFMDIVKPATEGKLSLSELRQCGLGYDLISALTNVRKYVAWEGLACEKAAGRASNLRDTRDWDLFADREYRRLVDAEEEDAADDEEGGGDGEP